MLTLFTTAKPFRGHIAVIQRNALQSWRALNPNIEVSIYDDRDLLGFWDCAPEMIVAADVHQHAIDQWNGILNMPTRFSTNEVDK
jgi:hypothetical protein